MVRFVGKCMIIHPFLFSFSFLNLLSSLWVSSPQSPLSGEEIYRDLGRRWCIGWIDGRALAVADYRIVEWGKWKKLIGTDGLVFWELLIWHSSMELIPCWGLFFKKFIVIS